MSSSEDPDGTAHFEPFHQDICCLQKPIITACGSERVNSYDVGSTNVVRLKKTTSEH